MNEIFCEDCLETLKKMDRESINCVITSPPYYGLRDYGVDKQIGLESTPEEYVSKLVEIFREIRRVLKKDGTVWLNLVDSYAGSGKGGQSDEKKSENWRPEYPHDFGRQGKNSQVSKLNRGRGTYSDNILKPKDLIGIPWRVAFALQSDGWWLRQDIIWCLSGGTWIYARTQKGDMPMMIRDLYRLKPETVKLWTGNKWVQMLGISKSKRIGDEIELVLRSGERISCSINHKFPTNRGIIESKDIKIGDIIDSCSLPEPEIVRDCAIDEDAAWLAGLYIAEGSMSEDTIQISGHAKESERWVKIQMIAKKYGGYATCTIKDNCMNIRIYGKILRAIIDELVTGKTAKDKAFAPVVWRYSDKFISSIIEGYLSGDGHWDEPNNRWRIGFTRNYNLERDLRTACARLGYHLTLKLSTVKYNGKDMPTFRGELRKERSGHFNEKNMGEVVEIRKARCRNLYDLGVEEPNIFSLASGIITSNSKPNPMPESVTDRCTKAHEYIFLLTKSAQYYYDAEAIMEKAMPDNIIRNRDITKLNNTPGRTRMGGLTTNGYKYANKRSVWTVTTKPFKEAHFATFPEDLIKPCILAGCPECGVVYDPFMGAGTTAVVALKTHRNFIGSEINADYIKIAENRIAEILQQYTLW